MKPFLVPCPSSPHPPLVHRWATGSEDKLPGQALQPSPASACASRETAAALCHSGRGVRRGACSLDRPPPGEGRDTEAVGAWNPLRGQRGERRGRGPTLPPCSCPCLALPPLAVTSSRKPAGCGPPPVSSHPPLASELLQWGHNGGASAGPAKGL